MSVSHGISTAASFEPPKDLELISYAETAQECWQMIENFYRQKPAARLPRGQ